MFRRLIVPACASLALLSGATLAQAPTPNGAQDDQNNKGQNNKGMSDQEIQHGPQKLRDKLAADGYTDVEIAPGSYVVSAKDKDGNKVVMMIGPHSMTMMKVPDKNPSQAQIPGTSDDQIIQQ
jgi:hypothetical protein